MALNKDGAMPRTKKARKRHTRHTANALRATLDRALDMEEPLNDAVEFVQALRIMGDGMVADDDNDGRAIAAVARAALRRLDVLEDVWSRLIKAAQRRTASH